jgi:Tol biopolymer transport system component
MALTPGTRIGPYEVVGSLGAGGMGEVYRARDAKLGRDVALKLLPAAFASDPERLARFDREAQVLASLNHPHIAQIYGFEESGDSRALVMELVDGPTLADVIVSSPLEVAETLRIARQIALALEAAHERGITHRDLKPSNVKIAADGSVKVLDFGLAKLSSGSDSSMRSAIEVTASPTLMSPTLVTGVGVILGTAAYMSPEQARGRAVDKRSDIWAFGCVLYEMLTGRRAFSGEDVSDTLAGILRGDPDWSLISSSVSPTVRQYLKRCLAKDPAQRVHDIADVRLALDGAFDVPAEAVGAPSVSPRWARQRLALASAIAGVAILAGVSGVLLAPWLFPADPPRVMRLGIFPPDGTRISPSQLESDVAVSRDGSRVAFVNRDVEQQSRLNVYVRSLDRLELVRIEGATLPRYIFFSPDGESLGFFDGAALKRVSANGGPVVTITPITGVGAGASWGEDGTVVFSTSASNGLMRISETGGEPTRVTMSTGGEVHAFSEILPGGRTVLFTRGGGLLRGSNAQIAIADLESGTVTDLISGGSYARYSSSGHIVYGFSGTLRAVAFDLKTLTIRGAPVPVVQGVITKLSGAANFALAQNGSLVYEAGDSAITVERQLVWVDREGREELLPAEKRTYVYPRISPDGSRVALDVRDQENDIWLWDFARRSLQRFTFDPGLNRGAAWLPPDGRRLIFSAESDGSESLFWQAADGSGKPERLTTGQLGRPQSASSITPDGGLLLFAEPGQPPFDLLVLRLVGDRKSAPLLNTSYSEHNGEVSPDGRWLAYQSDESGRNEIYVRRFPSLDSRAQVSTGGGTRPAWARNGREMFYLGLNGTMMAVPVERSEGSSLVTAPPKQLFKGEYFAIQAGRTYDVSPDGKRFLMIKDAAPRTAASPQLLVVTNWFEELKRLGRIRNQSHGQAEFLGGQFL